MSTKFYVPAKTSRNKFFDIVNKGEAVTYEIDFSSWQEDNSTITSIIWEVLAGSASVSGESLAAGVASALVTFGDRGLNLISVLTTTASEKRKVYLEIKVEDREYCGDYDV